MLINQFLAIVLKYPDITFPLYVRKWVSYNCDFTFEECQTHLAELKADYPTYLDWVISAQNLKYLAGHTSADELKKIIRYFKDHVRGRIDNEKDVECLSIILKHAIDELLKIHRSKINFY